jgi:hypothetical protein
MTLPNPGQCESDPAVLQHADINLRLGEATFPDNLRLCIFGISGTIRMHRIFWAEVEDGKDISSWPLTLDFAIGPKPCPAR